MAKIYLDQASTSYPKAPSVAQAVYDYLNGSAVNVNRGGYQAAYSVEEQIFETREQLLRLFHFTSGKRQKCNLHSQYHDQSEYSSERTAEIRRPCTCFLYGTQCGHASAGTAYPAWSHF